MYSNSERIKDSEIPQFKSPLPITFFNQPALSSSPPLHQFAWLIRKYLIKYTDIEPEEPQMCDNIKI